MREGDEDAVWVALRWQIATPARGTTAVQVEALVASNLWRLAADEAQRAEREATEGTQITAVVRCPVRGIVRGAESSRPVVVLVSFEGRTGERAQARVWPVCVVPAEQGRSEWTMDEGVMQACLQAPCELRWGVVQ